MHFLRFFALFLLWFCLSFAPLTTFSASPSPDNVDRSLAVRKKPVTGERRVALIIGNNVYQDAPLKNPVNDANAMARVLRTTGFDVIVIKNADRRKMFASVKEFGQKLKKSDVGLFYYAGHGVQVDSANYLLPVDLRGSDLQDADDLRHNAFPLNELMDRMRDASTNNIIILDACRDNPFLAKLSRTASRGLAKVATPASTSILYSTDPGNTASDGVTGDNGVFTNRLVESIQKDGLELVDVMREVAVNVARDTNGAQRPIFDGVLSSRFYFRAPDEVATNQSPQVPGSSAITVDDKVVELRYWESTEKSGSAPAYQSYLKKFPNGDFADLAHDRLEQMTDSKAQQAEERSKQSEGRLAEQKASLERVNSQLAAKPQVVASLPTEKAAKKEEIKEKIGIFLVSDLTVSDEASGLTWVRNANYCGEKIVWMDVQKCIDRLNGREFAGRRDWRLPTIKELDQLVSYAKDKGWGDKEGHYIADYLNRNGFMNVKPEYSPSSDITAAIGATAGGSKVAMRRMWSGYGDEVVVGTTSYQSNYDMELSLLIVCGVVTLTK